MSFYANVTGTGVRMDTAPVRERLTAQHKPRVLKGHALHRFSYKHPLHGWVTIAYCSCRRYADEHLSQVGPHSSGSSAVQCWQRNHITRVGDRMAA